jgi:hypothetical protein
MVVAPEQGAIAKRRGKAVNDPALDGDNRLQRDGGAESRAALHSAKHGGERIPDAVNNIAAGVGRDGLLQG